MKLFLLGLRGFSWVLLMGSHNVMGSAYGSNTSGKRLGRFLGLQNSWWSLCAALVRWGLWPCHRGLYREPCIIEGSSEIVVFSFTRISLYLIIYTESSLVHRGFGFFYKHLLIAEISMLYLHSWKSLLRASNFSFHFFFFVFYFTCHKSTNFFLT